MIANSYSRTYENKDGLVSLEVTESDLSGINVKMLVRFADGRPDQSLAYQPSHDFSTVVDHYDQEFNKQVKSL